MYVRTQFNVIVYRLWKRKEPRPKVGASSKEKALKAWGSPPKPTLTIHARAKHRAFWLFHVNRANRHWLHTVKK
jgi:hypothetical protein